jgi:hypothetical protein
LEKKLQDARFLRSFWPIGRHVSQHLRGSSFRHFTYCRSSSWTLAIFNHLAGVGFDILATSGSYWGCVIVVQKLGHWG